MQSNTGKMQRQRWLTRLFAVIVCASLMLSSIAAAPYSLPVQQPGPVAAPDIDVNAIPTDSSRVNFHRIIFKFKTGADVTLQEQGLVSASGAELSPVQQTLQGLEVRPVFSAASDLTAKAQASAKDVSAMPALDQYYYAELPDATFEESQAVLEKLLADPMIELAHMEPIYLPASRNQIEADLTSQQGYLNPASEGGMDAVYAWTVTGGRGLDVQLIDIEEGWQIGHEDLSLKTSDLIESRNSSDLNWVNHGAAVAGIIAAINNNYGVTGIASDTDVRLVSTVDWLTPDAIAKAAAYSEPGDIILISQQALGPLSEETCPEGCECANFESIPIEYWPENFDAIYAATQLGIIVVEAAGNGAMNLDHARYGGRFDRSNRDSGAILVGAGTPDTVHAPVCDANYGKRIDLQGWGSDVVTTGYGDHGDSGESVNQYYTSSFGGTSAASAMVAGAISSLQGIAKHRGYFLSPSDMRDFLYSTGSPQGDLTDHKIGRFPNLRQAITQKLTLGVTLLAPPDNEIVPTLTPTLRWQAYFNATNYELQIATNSSFTSLVLDVTTTATELTLSTRLLTSTQYFWRVRPYVNSEWEDWSANVFHFTVDAGPAPAVTLLKPATKALITNTVAFQPEFTWKEPANIPDGYEIQVSTSYDFTDGIDEYVPGNTYSLPDPGLTPNSRYYWRVRSYFGTPPDDASFGPWTGRWVLYTALDVSGIGPLQISANDDTLRPMFDWSDIENSRGYQVQVSKVETFKSIVYAGSVGIPSDGDIVPSELTPDANLPRSSDLFWRVRAKGLYGWSSWSETGTLSTLNPPGVPVLYTPGNLAATNTWEEGTLFTWSKPGGSPDLFHIQIATDKKFENIALEDDAIGLPDPDGEIKVPNYTAFGLEPENAYYWRVRAIGDGASTWSSVRIFYTTPPAPTGLAVEASDTLRPTFNWEKVDVARSYQLQVALDNLDTPDENKYKLFSGTRLIASVITLSSPPYMITTTLPRTNPDKEPDKSFIWRVRAGGQWGYSAWSEISTLTTPNPPNAPVLASPTNGSNLSNFNPKLDWYDSIKISNNPASNAVGYQLQISNRSSFVVVDPENDTLIEITEDQITGSAYTLSPMDLPTSGTYYWRVRAVNEAGEFSIWSSVFSFNTPAMVSGQVVDALSEEPIANAVIQVSGRAMQTTTDADGNYIIRGMPAGSFDLIIAASGYMRQMVNVSTNYTANRIRNVALAPIPGPGEIRIALTWGGSPADMDAHLWLPPTNQGHVYKDNPEPDGSMAIFERPDDDGYGPEIITLSETFTGLYRFAAYTPSSVSALASSRARVTVYYVDPDGKIDQLATINITNSGSGHWWKAFTFDGATRKITVQNVITDANPAPYADPVMP